MKAKLTSRLAEANATPSMRPHAVPLRTPTPAATAAAPRITCTQPHAVRSKAYTYWEEVTKILSSRIPEIPVSTAHAPETISRMPANRAHPVADVVERRVSTGPDVVLLLIAASSRRPMRCTATLP